MGSYRGIDIVILICQFHRIAGRFQTAAGIHQQLDLLVGKIPQQLRAVDIKSAVVHMGMSIKKHGHSPSKTAT